MSGPDAEREVERQRALRWAEQDVGTDRTGRTTVRPPTRPFALAGVALGVLAAVASAVTGSGVPVATAYLAATVVGGLALVVGLVLFVVGWARGPKGPFAAHTAPRRVGTRLLLVATGCLVLLVVALLGDQLLTLLG